MILNEKEKILEILVEQEVIQKSYDVSQRLIEKLKI